ncbi:hypothetical protein EYF80_008199 [Liparis tanakae]|uniref:Uncharacterized protein n=1 Tax=Liparis tanakae TaxID=230148 RepID=A0A4Z2IUK4_9TELE|nr:hypothetical protein EYF80_008199 [Liparis tanakae]
MLGMDLDCLRPGSRLDRWRRALTVMTGFERVSPQGAAVAAVFAAVLATALPVNTHDPKCYCTRISSGSKLCSLQAEVMLLLRHMLNCSPSGVRPAAIMARLSSGLWHTEEVQATRNHSTTSRITSSSRRTRQLVM